MVHLELQVRRERQGYLGSLVAGEQVVSLVIRETPGQLDPRDREDQRCVFYIIFLSLSNCTLITIWWFTSI